MQNPNPPLEPSRPPLPPDEPLPTWVPDDLDEDTPEHFEPADMPNFDAVPPFDDILTPDDPPGRDDAGK